MKFKADFHIHTAEDPQDVIEYTAEELIEHASLYGYDVLAITNHTENTVTPELIEFADSKGILLLPGFEADIKGKHLVVINPSSEMEEAGTFDELFALKGENSIFIAPHPYYPSRSSLRGVIKKNAHMFDAIEYCSFYLNWLNFNHIGKYMSKRLGIPMVGGSDAHYRWQFGSTFTLVEAAERTPKAIVRAIKSGQVEVVTNPLKPRFQAMRFGLRALGVPTFLLWGKKDASWV